MQFKHLLILSVLLTLAVAMPVPFIDGLLAGLMGGMGGGGGAAPAAPGGGGGGMAMPMSGMPGDPLIAISGAEDKLLGNKPH